MVGLSEREVENAVLNNGLIFSSWNSLSSMVKLRYAQLAVCCRSRADIPVVPGTWLGVIRKSRWWSEKMGKYWLLRG